MDKVIFLCRTGISDIGHGGVHRSYQILFDIKQVVGEDQVLTISIPEWLKSQRQSRWSSFWQTHGSQLNYFKKGLLFENPLNLIAHTPFTTRYFLPNGFWEDYKESINSIPGQLLSIIDDTRLAKAIDVNREFGIPTLLVSHNIESLDLGVGHHKGKRWLDTTLRDFANEMGVMEKLEEILVTSKVEAGLINGLGINTRYYPYVPVGSIKERLLDIREKRKRMPQTKGLFLLLGSANHTTTRDSMLWLVDQVASYGLPAGIHIVAVGRYTKKLPGEGRRIPGIDFRGWLPQEDLDQLLVSAAGVLVPQRSGFGALVRLPELACAGLPVIADPQPTYARGKTPGLVVARRDWTGWCHAMEEINAGDINITEQEYTAWERVQPNPFKEILDRYLKNDG